MSRMLAALRHLEQQASVLRNPPPIESAQADCPSAEAAPNSAAESNLAAVERLLSLLDAPPPVVSKIEFVENVSLVIEEIGLPGFVATVYDDGRAASAETAGGYFADAALIAASPSISSVLRNEPASGDEARDPIGLPPIGGPYPLGWPFRSERPNREMPPRYIARVAHASVASVAPSVAATPRLAVALSIVARANEQPGPTAAEDRSLALPISAASNASAEISEAAANFEALPLAARSERLEVAAHAPNVAVESIVGIGPVVRPESAVELYALADPFVAASPVSLAAPATSIELATLIAPSASIEPLSPVAEEASPVLPAAAKPIKSDVAVHTSVIDLKESRRASNAGRRNRPAADRNQVRLPDSDPEASTLYRRLCGRLLATHSKRDPNASTIAMFVAPAAVGAGELSLVEVARAAAETLNGRLLLVAADPHSEFLPSALRLGNNRGLAELWRGAAKWSEVALASDDPRIDVVAWGSGDVSASAGPLSWEGARAEYELVLVAGGSATMPITQRLAPTCDAVVVVVSLGITGQNEALMTTRRLGAIGAPLVGCVVTGAAL